MTAGPLPKLYAVADDGDSWGTDRRRYDRILGEFKPRGPARIVERGPVRTILETRAGYGSSMAVIQTIFHPSWPVVELRLRLAWNEAGARLKLGFPTSFRDAGGLFCEVPGGAVKRPADGDEHVHGRWCLAEGEIDGRPASFGVAHSGLHGVSFDAGEIRLSVLRGSAYCHERGFKLGPERAWKRADQGVHDIRLALTAGRPADLKRALPGLADWLSAPPAVYAHLPFGASAALGTEERSRDESAIASFLSISPTGIRLLACKKAEEGDALILRLQEANGRRTAARVSTVGPDSRGSKPVRIAAAFAPFEIRTYRIERTGRVRAVDPIRED
jgi:alpha-mannosidase